MDPELQLYRDELLAIDLNLEEGQAKEAHELREAVHDAREQLLVLSQGGRSSAGKEERKRQDRQIPLESRRRDGGDHAILSANEIHDDSGHAEMLEAELDGLTKKLAGLRGKGGKGNGPRAVPRAQACGSGLPPQTPDTAGPSGQAQRPAFFDALLTESQRSS